MEKFIIAVVLMLCASGLNAQTKGYEKSIEVGGGVGLDKMTKYSISIAMLNGYRFNDYVFVGIGAGYKMIETLYYQSYQHSRGYSSTYNSFDTKNLIQLYGRIKANLTKSNVSPFLQFDLGTSFDVGSNPNKTAQGVMFEPAFGVDVKLNSSKAKLYFALGYNAQSSKYSFINTTLGDSYSENIKSLSGCLNFKIGFVF